MRYKYCQNENYGDFASGSVILSKQGYSNFPVGLAQEIYCRCLSYLKSKNNICIYDPCCGGGYLLTVLGFLNPDSLKVIIGSDFNEDAVNFAVQNLGLLTVEGLGERAFRLQSLYSQFNKSSHKQAIESAESLMGILNKYNPKYEISVFQADMTLPEALKHSDFKADIVMTDVPYGNLSSWQISADGYNPDAYINILLDNVIPVLKPDSVVAVCSDKQQKIISDKFTRLERQKIGKRKFEILRLNN